SNQSAALPPRPAQSSSALASTIHSRSCRSDRASAQYSFALSASPLSLRPASLPQSPTWPPHASPAPLSPVRRGQSSPSCARLPFLFLAQKNARVACVVAALCRHPHSAFVVATFSL